MYYKPYYRNIVTANLKNSINSLEKTKNDNFRLVKDLFFIFSIYVLN